MKTRMMPGRRRDLPLDLWVEPEVVFTALFSGGAHSFWLDSGRGASTGLSYMGAPTATAPIVTYRVGDAGVEVRTGADSTPHRSTRDIFEVLADSTETSIHGSEFHEPGAHGSSGFVGGWVGWFGYELGSREVGSPSHRSPDPDAAFMFVERVVIFDHAAGMMTLRAGGDAADDNAWFSDTREAIARLAANMGSVPSPDGDPAGGLRDARMHRSRAEYLELSRRCRAVIDDGDAYQICLTNEVEVETTEDPLEVYRRLRRRNPSHHGGMIRFEDVALLSSSPEQFLYVGTDRMVTTRPIKGTRPRSDDPCSDDAQRAELLASEKERAENVMIVDLMRNDLARTAVVGSTTVADLYRVESYANVHQLVSTVTARLADGRTALDVVRACLPAGSMSGAPKRSAMTWLDELEGRPRGLYAGAFGYIGADGSLDLAMTIRSIVMRPGRATLGVGGGITTLSNDAEEFDETLLKARPLLEALEAQVR
jgi:para-aminobenzoate synthetase component 1